MKQLLSKSEQFKIHLGDCIPHMLEEMPENSVDFAVFSPPFPALYAYSDAAGDIGNVDRMDDEARVHLSFFFKGLLRVLKPGRVAICHICQIPKMKKNGETGLSDFRGTCIKLGHRAGFIYEYDWAISKNPQLQSIRNKVSEMAFTTSLERDRTRCRGAILDYLIKLKKPGENKVPVVNNEVTRNDWIRYAEGCWTDIIETDTLNTKAAKSEDDVRHIAPLQLEVIRRCVLMYSNPGEIVFSPFTGIGSEGFMSLGGVSPKTGNSIANPRRFYGCELKPEYFNQANKNLRSIASRKNEQVDLFEIMNDDCDSCETVDESEKINA